MILRDMLEKETVEAMFVVAKSTKSNKSKKRYRPGKKKEAPKE